MVCCLNRPGLSNPGGGGGGKHSTFFQVGVCGPDFWSVGLANWYLPLKRGLVNWKFPNLGVCELKISKFSRKGVLWTDSFAWNGTLASGRRGVKGGFQGRTSPYPLSRSVPPPEFPTCGPQATCSPRGNTVHGRIQDPAPMGADLGYDLCQINRGSRGPRDGGTEPRWGTRGWSRRKTCDLRQFWNYFDAFWCIKISNYIT